MMPSVKIALSKVGLDGVCRGFPEVVAALFVHTDVPQDAESMCLRRDVDQNAVAVTRLGHAEKLEAAGRPRFEAVGPAVCDMNAYLTRRPLFRARDRSGDAVMVQT
jgi:hypothetical protein